MRKSGILSAAALAFSAAAFAGMANAETSSTAKSSAAAAASPAVAPAASSLGVSAGAVTPAQSASGGAPSAPAKAAAGPAATPSGPAIAPSAGAQTSVGAASSGAFTDAQLKSYVGAQKELTILSTSAGGLANPTPETQAQMAAILQRYQIDGQTFNKISASARSDKKLAERLASLQANSTVKTQ